MVIGKKNCKSGLKNSMIILITIMLVYSASMNFSAGDSQEITTSSESRDSPWLMFRGDLKRTGRSEYSTEYNTGSKSWSFSTTGRVTTSITTGPGSTLYFGVSYVGTDEGDLYAIDTNGTERWNFNTDGFVYSTPTVEKTVISISVHGTVIFILWIRKAH
ncbi:MAG: PQQ-binding-like beta-propeller repeat protein [Candidatus Saliniplasma sp.]